MIVELIGDYDRISKECDYWHRKTDRLRAEKMPDESLIARLIYSSLSDRMTDIFEALTILAGGDEVKALDWIDGTDPEYTTMAAGDYDE